MTIVAAGATEKGYGGLQVVFVNLTASVELLEAVERDVPRLSATDIARVQLEHDPERQRLWRSSRIATRIVLERALGTAYRNIDFEIAENGRPSLGDGPPYFNVSHSGGAALIAVSNAVPVGIDLEEERGLKMTEDRRRRVIAAAARLANGQPASMSRSDADLDLVRAWVRLEAAAKSLGIGIGQLLTEEGVVGGKPADGGAATAASRLDVRNLDVATGYLAAVAAATLPRKIEVLTLPNDADALTEFLSCAQT